MTNVNFSYKDLEKLMGKEFPQDKILENLQLIGSDTGDTVPGSDEMTVEFFPNRPDMYGVEGIARAMRAFLGMEPGLKEYKVEDSDIKAVVTPEVKEIRPYFMCAAVFGAEIDDTALRSIMEMQEKLHITVGRKRTKLAIGIHDLDKVTPPFTFRAADPDTFSFVPLAKTEEMTMRQILSEHEKGKAYAHLMDGMEKFPVITDAEGKVLSFPPIINGALTAVTTSTKNLFVDVTGFDAGAVESCVNIVTTALAERGGVIKRVHMEGAPKESYPNLEPRTKTVSLAECNRFIGYDLTPEQAVAALGRMGLGAECSGDSLTVRIPAYRLDFLHDADVYEDVAIGFGFDNYGKKRHDVTQTFGKLLPETTFSEKVKDIMIGLGYTELTTLTLSNARDEFGISGLPEVDSVTVKNPITEDHTCLRSYLMPSLMKILRHNKHRDLPQKIFEVGYVIRDSKTVLHLCALQAASRSSFTEVKSLTESVLREIGTEYSLETCQYSTFIPGRGASVMVKGKQIGVFGEMSPKTITDYEMTHPVIMMEIDLTDMIAENSGSLF